MSRLADNLSQNPALPAWLVSALLHGSLVLLLAFSAHSMPGGAVPEALRATGIVLKTYQRDGVKYTDEASATIEATSHSGSAASSTESANAALPDAETLSTASSALPEVASLGPLPVDTGLIGGGGTRDADGTGLGQALAGNAARVSVFGVEGVGSKFVYVFDRSSSMQGAPLRAAKAELVASLESLAAIHQFQIVFFSTELLIPTLDVQQRIAFASDRNKLLAERFLAEVQAGGGTERVAALLRAIAMSPDVIFFLTDVDDPMPAAEVARVLERNARVGATIQTIEFGSGPPPGGDSFLRQLARATGGKHGYVDVTRLGQ